MYIQFWRDTCAVAELDGQIIGWCSIICVSSETYFFHQLGVASHARRLGIGKSLFTFVLKKLKARHEAFSLEFTVDRRNKAAFDLDCSVAAEAGMAMTKKPDTVPAFGGSEEELYVMAHDERQCPAYRGRREGPFPEIFNVSNRRCDWPPHDLG
jgi:GNAT superfamily N-acetyltransferase